MQPRHLPASKEKRGGQARKDDGLDKIIHQEHAEFHSGILREISDDFCLSLGQVKRRSFGLSRPGREKQDKRQRLDKDSPGRQPATDKPALPANSLAQVQSSVNEKRTSQGG